MDSSIIKTTCCWPLSGTCKLSRVRGQTHCSFWDKSCLPSGRSVSCLKHELWSPIIQELKSCAGVFPGSG